MRFSQVFEKDIDFDGVIDTICINERTSKIVCLLSTNHFSKIESKEIDLNFYSGIRDAKNGFYFDNHYMRAGYSNQFRFDKKTKQLRLIGIQTYHYCSVNCNDPCGVASVNLLTGDFIADWVFNEAFNFYNDASNYVKIPTVKAEMRFEKQYIEGFNEDVYFDFNHKLSEIARKQRDVMLQKRMR